MDISQLETREAHEDGAEMQVKGPDGKPTDFYIKVVGVDSDKYRQLRRDVERKVARGEEVDIAGYYSKATLGWRGAESNGKELPFSEAAAYQVYRNAPYICDQVEQFAMRRVNFIKTSSGK